MPAVNDDDAVTTEAEGLADIVGWSANRPLWQRDALRRLTEAEELTAQDIDGLTALCKDRSLAATPLSADHVRVPDAGMPPVHLRAISDVLNINAFAEGQRLNFLSGGVTIIYGDNGSGNSGYVRVLKRACRARGPDERQKRRVVFLFVWGLRPPGRPRPRPDGADAARSPCFARLRLWLRRAANTEIPLSPRPVLTARPRLLVRA